MASLQQGSIVWAQIRDPNGQNPKQRPAVVVTATEDIKPGEPVVVVAATTKFDTPLPADCVALPWHPTGKVRTGLRKVTVACCSWLCAIQIEDIDEVGGIVPAKVMLEIIKKVNELA